MYKEVVLLRNVGAAHSCATLLEDTVFDYCEGSHSAIWPAEPNSVGWSKPFKVAGLGMHPFPDRLTVNECVLEVIIQFDELSQLLSRLSLWIRFARSPSLKRAAGNS